MPAVHGAGYATTRASFISAIVLSKKGAGALVPHKDDSPAYQLLYWLIYFLLHCFVFAVFDHYRLRRLAHLAGCLPRHAVSGQSVNGDGCHCPADRRS